MTKNLADTDMGSLQVLPTFTVKVDIIRIPNIIHKMLQNVIMS